MLEFVNLAILGSGFVLFALALTNFTMAFAMWCAVFPIVLRVTPIIGSLPSCRVVTGALFLAAIFRFLRDPNIRLPRHPLWLIYSLFFFSAFISAALSDYPIESLAKAASYAEPLIWVMMGWLSVMTSRRAMVTVTTGILVGLAVVASVGVLEFIYKNNSLYSSGLLHLSLSTNGEETDYSLDNRLGFSGRVMSTLGHPTATALYIVCALPLGLFFARYLAKSLVSKVACIVLAGIGVTCLIFTGTRAGYVAILLAPLAYSMLSTSRARSLKMLIPAYVVAFLVIQVLPAEFLEYNIDSFRFSGYDPSSAAAGSLLSRLDLTQRLLDLATIKPLFGLGPGYIPLMDLAGLPLVRDLGGSENQYAMLLAETGIAGLATYLLFIGGSLHLLFSLRKHKDAIKAEWAAVSGSMFFPLFAVAVSVTVISSLPMLMILTYLGMAMAFYDQSVRVKNRQDQVVNKTIMATASES
jgi:O-antigen ligase